MQDKKQPRQLQTAEVIRHPVVAGLVRQIFEKKPEFHSLQQSVFLFQSGSLSHALSLLPQAANALPTHPVTNVVCNEAAGYVLR